MKNIPVRHISATKKEQKPEEFSIRAIREVLAGKDMVQDLHRHDFFLILVLKKGKGSHEIDFTSYKVSDNVVFIVRPGQVHQLSLKAGSTGYVLQFKPDFYNPISKAANQILRRASSKNVCYPDADRFKKLLSILAYIFQEYTDKQEGYEEIIEGNLGIFFAELIRQKGRKPSASTNFYTQERLEEFLRLLETNVFTKKQVSQYAELLNLSVYQLNAITKAALNKTCSQLIDEYIILEAKRNLLATSGQVNQIAYLLGYEDVSYFIRFFKKHTGYSPEAFRNNFS